MHRRLWNPPAEGRASIRLWLLRRPEQRFILPGWWERQTEHRICQEARENGIKDTFLGKKEGYTGKAIIQIDQAGQNSIVLFGGANRKWTLEYVDKVLEHFQAEDILILQNEINVTAEIITKAWEKGMKIVLNPSPFEEKVLNWPLEKVFSFSFK